MPTDLALEQVAGRDESVTDTRDRDEMVACSADRPAHTFGCIASGNGEIAAKLDEPTKRVVVLGWGIWEVVRYEAVEIEAGERIVEDERVEVGAIDIALWIGSDPAAGGRIVETSAEEN